MLKAAQKWLRARITLGWALAKHVMSWPINRRQRDPERWLLRMGTEHLGATPKDNWPQYAQSSGCVGCGLCDLFGTGALPRPSLLIQGAARLPSDAPFVAQEALDALRAIASDVARICPQGVDTAAIGSIIANNRAMLKGLRKNATP